MPIMSSISLTSHIPLLASRVSNRRTESKLVVGPNGQASIVSFDSPAGSGEDSSNPEDHRSPEFASLQTAQLSSIPISATTAAQTASQLTQSYVSLTTAPAFSGTTTGTISSSLRTTAPTSSLSSPTPAITATATTTTNTPSNFASSTVTPTPGPSALVSPASMHAARHDFPAPFYVAIILGTVCICACAVAFLAWWMRSRASTQKPRDDDELWTTEDVLDDGREPSLQERTPHEESEFYLPASIVRRDTGDPFHSPVPAATTTTTTATAANYHKTYDRPPSGFNHSRLGSGEGYPSMSMEQRRPMAPKHVSAFSVQENPRTLGRLQVANIAPGDMTSGDESSHSYGGPTYHSTRTGGLYPRSAGHGQQRFLPREEDGMMQSQSLPSPRDPQRTPRERPRQAMEDTPDIGPGEWHNIPLPDDSEQHDPIVHEHPPPEGWASVLKSNLMTAFGAVSGNRTPRPSTILEESDDVQEYPWPHPFPDPDHEYKCDVPPAASTYCAEPHLRNSDIGQCEGLHIRGGLGSNNRVLSSSSFPGVSHPNHGYGDSQLTLRPGMPPEAVWTQVPPAAFGGGVGIAKSSSPMPDRSRASQGSSSISVYSSESAAAAAENLKNYGYGFTQSQQGRALMSSSIDHDDLPRSRTNTMQSGHSKVSSRKRGGGYRKRSRPKPIQRESSSASSMISFGSDLLRPPHSSGHLSMRESSARKALLERRRKSIMQERLDE